MRTPDKEDHTGYPVADIVGETDMSRLLIACLAIAVLPLAGDASPRGWFVDHGLRATAENAEVACAHAQAQWRARHEFGVTPLERIAGRCACEATEVVDTTYCDNVDLGCQVSRYPGVACAVVGQLAGGFAPGP